MLLGGGLGEEQGETDMITWITQATGQLGVDLITWGCHAGML